MKHDAIEKEHLEVRRGRREDGGCNYCLNRETVVIVNSSRPSGGMQVRFCFDCLQELTAKFRRLS